MDGDEERRTKATGTAPNEPTKINRRDVVVSPQGERFVSRLARYGKAFQALRGLIEEASELRWRFGFQIVACQF